jgi:hypothetical protein
MDAFLRFGGLVILIVAVLVGITILLMKKFKNKIIIKVLPTILAWVISIIFFIMGAFFAQPMQDLGYYVMAMITGMSAFITLVVTIIIDKKIKF